MTTGGQDLGAEQELLNDLRDLQNYVTQFQGVIDTARQAAPARASANDATGMAFAEIDGEGMPTTLKITQGWSSSLSAGELGPALIEAYQTAIQQHMEQWSDDLGRQGWQFDAREFDEKVAQAPTPEQNLFPAPSNPLAPRGMSSIIQDVLGELDQAHDLATSPPAPAARTTTAPTGRVGVTIANNSLTSVHVDPEWADGRDSASINSELAGALQSARLQQGEQPTGSPHTARLDDLFGEVMSALTNHRMEK